MRLVFYMSRSLFIYLQCKEKGVVMKQIGLTLVVAILFVYGVCRADEAADRQKARKLRAEAAYLELKGQPDKALELYEQSLKLAPDPVMQKKIAQLKGASAAPSLPQAAVTLGDVAARLDVQAEMFTYMNSEAVIRSLRQGLGDLSKIMALTEEEEGSRVLGMFDKILDWSGCYSVRAAGFSMAPVKQDVYRVKSYLARDPEAADRFIWKLCGGPSRALDSLGYAPADSAVLMIANSDPAGIWAGIREAIAAFGGPDMSVEFDASLQHVESMAQIKLADLIGALGNEQFLSLGLSRKIKVSIPIDGDPFDIPQPSLLLGLKVNGDLLLTTLLQKMAEAKLPMVKSEVDGLALYSVNVPVPSPFPLQPTLAQSGSMLLFGSSPDVVKTAVAAAKNRDGLCTDASFKQHFPGLPDKLNNLVFVSPRVGGLVRDLQKQLIAIAPDEVKAKPELLEYLNKMGDQTARTFLAFYSVNEPDALYIEGVLNCGSYHPALVFNAAPFTLFAGLLGRRSLSDLDFSGSVMPEPEVRKLELPGLQMRFFDTVLYGSADEVMNLMHPALYSKVDEPMLETWMIAVQNKLGELTEVVADSLEETELKEGGVTKSTSKAKVMFEKGQA